MNLKNQKRQKGSVLKISAGRARIFGVFASSIIFFFFADSSVMAGTFSAAEPKNFGQSFSQSGNFQAGDRPISYYGLSAGSALHGGSSVSVSQADYSGSSFSDGTPSGAGVYYTNGGNLTGSAMGSAIDLNSARSIVPGGNFSGQSISSSEVSNSGGSAMVGSSHSGGNLNSSADSSLAGSNLSVGQSQTGQSLISNSSQTGQSLSAGNSSSGSSYSADNSYNGSSLKTGDSYNNASSLSAGVFYAGSSYGTGDSYTGNSMNAGSSYAGNSISVGNSYTGSSFNVGSSYAGSSYSSGSNYTGNSMSVGSSYAGGSYGAGHSVSGSSLTAGLGYTGGSYTYNSRVPNKPSPKPAEPKPCEEYLKSYLGCKKGDDPVEVRKLQVFLRDYEGEKIEINGIYDKATELAVRRFQDKYSIDVLKESWGLDCNTGCTYITTRAKINDIVCKTNTDFKKIALPDPRPNFSCGGIDPKTNQPQVCPDTQTVVLINGKIRNEDGFSGQEASVGSYAKHIKEKTQSFWKSVITK